MTTRRAGLDPAFAAPYGQHLVDADFSELERRLERQGQTQPVTNYSSRAALGLTQYDSPAGPYAGVFHLYFDRDEARFDAASGNARQRRRQVRAWKRQGFTVTQTNAATGATITR
jgi:hypothetical protein